jgi:hypothetical protein
VVLTDADALPRDLGGVLTGDDGSGGAAPERGGDPCHHRD